jgi:hypothetical protein
VSSSQPFITCNLAHFLSIVNPRGGKPEEKIGKIDGVRFFPLRCPPGGGFPGFAPGKKPHKSPAKPPVTLPQPAG